MEERPAAVLVDGVSKSFRLPHERVHTLKERVLHPLRGRGHDRLHVLSDVSFDIRHGEFFGIVGRNGSGKSTLLKLLAGIYRADSGRIWLNGRLSTFIELGVGFNPDLAARDNVTINGIMLGLSPREARARFDRIIEFAELEDFVDLKLKNYSSGMQVRLAFSVMIQVDADILLIDEVLAVGDAAFQQKCFDVFHRLRDEHKTIVFVTHDMAAVKRFCNRALLIDSGRIEAIGDPDEIANRYVALNFGDDGRQTSEDEGERYGTGDAAIADAWFEDADGRRTATLPHGRPCRFRARVVFRRRVEHPAVAVLLENDVRHPLFATTSEEVAEESGVFEAGDEVELSVGFDNVLTPGRIYATPWVIRRGGELLDRRVRMLSAVVTGTRHTGALLDPPHDVSLTRLGTSAEVAR